MFEIKAADWKVHFLRIGAVLGPQVLEKPTTHADLTGMLCCYVIVTPVSSCIAVPATNGFGSLRHEFQNR